MLKLNHSPKQQKTETSLHMLKLKLHKTNVASFKNSPFSVGDMGI